MEEKTLRCERAHLGEIIAIAREQIALLEQQIKTSEENILAAKQEMRGETAHAIYGNLWSPDAFEQLNELNQFATQVSNSIASHEAKLQNLERLKRLIVSPYFARVDFTFQNKTAPTQIYIGRSTLQQKQDILIFDWRAPIASLFYRHTLGEASYKAPMGTITGSISLKRQYEIKDGRLEYFFDADMEILDDYLRRLLSKNASSQMKSIVETIQREQDVAIRDDQNDVLVVQGVAGSGKTSVALHRAAYLMYSGLTGSLGHENIAIISPNSVFERYISKVLPELGEENVNSYILEELYDDILGASGIQTRFEWLEQGMTSEGPWVHTMKSSLSFKCSKAFVSILDTLEPASCAFADVMAVYSALFGDVEQLQAAARKAGVDLPADIVAIAQYTKENLASSALFFDDVSALAYLRIKKEGIENYALIRQVVIDEAQDYYYLHYRMFKLLFPNAKYTILGDINQTIEKPENMGFYDGVLQAIGKKRNLVVTLEKSFRCTNQITCFGAQILGKEIKAFGRDGEPPVLRRLRGEGDVQALLADAQNCKALGYESIGIICKTMRDCRALYERIKDKTDVSLLDSSAHGSIAGVFILPVYLSKGLEFDAAFVWGADDQRFGEENDRQLLFIACTRAMHCLRLYTWGGVSPFCAFLFDDEGAAI